MGTTANSINNIISSKSNIIIVAVLLTILTSIGFAINMYLENSVTDRKIELTKMKDERLRKEADKKIANAPFKAW